MDAPGSPRSPTSPSRSLTPGQAAAAVPDEHIDELRSSLAEVTGRAGAEDEATMWGVRLLDAGDPRSRVLLAKCAGPPGGGALQAGRVM